jgi:phosphomannomutase
MNPLPCFKAYDLRRRVFEELDSGLAYRIGQSYAGYLQPRRVAVGRDVPLNSVELAEALASGVTEAGAEVVDLGLCSAEQEYFYTAALKLDGGIIVTASHDPPNYNGMKFVRQGSRLISGHSGQDALAVRAH